MSRTYSGWHARWYSRIWRRFEQRTLAAAIALIDWEALAARQAQTQCGASLLRILDVACGTGLLLRRLCARLSEADAELYGVDASADMLAQARAELSESPHTYLLQARVGTGPTADLPFSPQSFDLVTCTNAASYFRDPVGVLRGLAQQLAPGGQLVLVDYARQPPPFPWPFFAWVVRRLDPGHVRAYTLQEARELCQRAGLRVEASSAYTIDWLWRGWGLRAQAVLPTALPRLEQSARDNERDVVADTLRSAERERRV